MNIDDFKEGEKFIIIYCYPYNDIIYKISTYTCIKKLKTCIKVEENKKIEKNFFENCFPIKMLEEMKKKQYRSYVDYFKWKFTDDKKSKMELLQMKEAIEELLKENKND